MAFNGRFILNIAHFAAQIGGDFKKLIAITGNSTNELNREHSTVSNAVYNEVIETAIFQTKDECLGLHAGENLNLAAAGLIGQITMSCETVLQAFKLCCEYANLGCSVLPMQFNLKDGQYELIMVPDPLWHSESPVATQQTIIGSIAFKIREFQALTRLQYSPIKVHLPWDKPINTSEYERVFGCPIIFNQEYAAVYFNQKEIEEKVQSSDYKLLRILIQHAEQKSSELFKQNGYASLVKNAVIKLAKKEFPTIEQVAAHLNVSLRTLQRKLKEENYTYKYLLNELKEDFAKSYLKRHELSIAEIAYMLRYSETSAFTRAFKSWTGVSPSAYRETAE